MDILNQLFEFDDYNNASVECVVVEGVTLKVPIGKFPAGSEFDYAEVDWPMSMLRLTIKANDSDNDEKEYIFNLKLTATDAPLT